MPRKKIAVFTGKRGGFGAMLRIMRGVMEHPDLELMVIASDMHLNPTFGNTIDEVRSRVPVDEVVDIGPYGDTALDRTVALGKVVQGLAPVLEKRRPDILLLLGDRGETLAAAMCAAEMGVVIAHIQAGDISGGLDDIHRHAITKLSHLHFSQNERQRQRVIRLGEDEWRVFNTGAPYVDNIVHAEHPGPDEALRTLGLEPGGPYAIMLHHPDTYRPGESYAQAKAVLGALKAQEQRTIVVYPCSDPGYQGVLDALREFADVPYFQMFPSIDHQVFLGLMSGASFLVGNSSGGIIEAPYFRLPFVNVGLRQAGRDKAANVIDAAPEAKAIAQAMEQARSAGFRARMDKDQAPFGDGNASRRILDVLERVEVTPELFRKRIAY